MLCIHNYEVRPRKDNRGADLISDVLPFGRLWYGTPDHAIGYPMHSSRSHDAVIQVYDTAGKVIETHEAQGRLHKVLRDQTHRELVDPFAVPQTQSAFHSRV